MVKIKILKKLISIVCAATVVTSCVAPSVGAFKSSKNSKAEVVKVVGDLNEWLSELNKAIDGMLTITRREVTEWVDDNFDRQIELATLLSNLEEAKRYANKLNEVVVDDYNVAITLRDRIIGACVEHKLKYDEETDPEYCYYIPDSYFNAAKTMREKLESINEVLKKGDNNKLASLKKEFEAKVKEFYDRETRHYEFVQRMGKDCEKDFTCQVRKDAKGFTEEVRDLDKKNCLTAENINKAMKYLKQAIDEMDQYENINNEKIAKKKAHKAKKAEKERKERLAKEEKAKKEAKNGSKLNEKLDRFANIVDAMLNATKKERKSYLKNDDDQVKFLILFSALESSQALLKEIRGVAVNDPDFANKIKEMIDDADQSVSKIYNEPYDIDHPNKIYLQFKNSWFNQVPKMFEKLEIVQKLMKENVKK